MALHGVGSMTDDTSIQDGVHEGFQETCIQYATMVSV